MLNTDSLSVNDLFCGAGGMGLGFKEAGFSIAGAWDIDKQAVMSYKANVGEHVKQADITTMTWKDLPHAHVWSFGFPCQDLSIESVFREGLNVQCVQCGHRWEITKDSKKCPNCGCGECRAANRSGLLFEVMRLLNETKENDPSRLPYILLAENVKGLKKYLPALAEEYEKRGYSMYYKLFNSKDWGVPQKRERYFVVGIRKDIDNGKFEFTPEPEGSTLTLRAIAEKQVDEKYYLTDSQIEKISKWRSFRNPLDRMKTLDDVMPTLTARGAGGYHSGMVIIKEDDGRLRVLTPRECLRLQGFDDDYKIVVSDMAIYKQMGNAVTVNVAKAVAESIKAYLTSIRR